MRRRACAALLAAGLAAAAAPAAATAAEEYLRPYTGDVDQIDAGKLAEMGVDLGHSGYDPSRSYTQQVEVVLYPSQARKLEARGVELTEVEIAKPVGTKEERQAATGGDSPNPHYTVYRQFMEPGGIHDEMLELAKENRDVVSYEVIGRSRLGKPMAVLKVTANARHTPDNTRPAVLYSSNNHAREWIAAEVERRLMRWIIEHKNDAKIAELLSRTELWFMRDSRRRARATRCRNRRTWRSTGCCARSTSSPTSTTTRPASSC